MSNPIGYDLNDIIRITGTFKDINGNLIDPSAVYFKYKDPNGNIVTLQYGVDAVIRSATGIYYYDMTATAVGTYYYRFYSTGSGQAAAEDDLVVKDTLVV